MRKKVNIFVAAVLFSFVLWGSISLSDYYYANINVKLSFINFPNGYTTGSALPENISIRVKGQGWKLVSLNVSPDADFKVSARNDSGRQSVNLYNNLEYNRYLTSELEIIDIIPDTINFFVEKIISKKVQVVPELDLDFKPGYGLATESKYSPDSVLVYGPKSFIRNLTQVKTETISFKGLDSKVKTIAALPRKNGVTYNNSVINVSLDVQRIVDKQFYDIDIEVVDVPIGKNVLLLPNKIECSVRGGIEVLGKLDKGQFRAYVYYHDVLADTLGSVLPNIDLPLNTNLQFIKPERLRYVIKSF